MRFEDTDRERSKKEYEKEILGTLQKLGLDFDKGPFRQSDRTEFYTDAIETMLRNGSAFEAEESKDGSGERVIRFKNTGEIITFKDVIRGEIKIDSTDFGDFVIARSKTNPLYHLTVVVDDIDMAVTDVIRGEDHITSTPRQILLIKALGGKIPRYAHLPLIVGEDRKKLGKRHGAVCYQDFEGLGYLPEALLNYLALLGWNPGDDREFFSKEELVKEFSLEKVNNSPATFSYTKLDDLNKKWMQKLSDEKYKEMALNFLSENMRKNFLAEPEKADKIIFSVIKERVSKFSEISELEKAGDFDYFFQKPEIDIASVNFKDTSEEETKEYLKEIISKLENLPEKDWSPEKIKELLWDWSGELGRGKVLHPTRYLLSGKKSSPDPFLLADVLGKAESLERLRFFEKSN